MATRIRSTTAHTWTRSSGSSRDRLTVRFEVRLDPSIGELATDGLRLEEFSRQSERSTAGVPERTRTSDLQVRNLTLYPLSYGHPSRAVAEREGFEPSEEETPFNGLANRRTRPLCDLSAERRR